MSPALQCWIVCALVHQSTCPGQGRGGNRRWCSLREVHLNESSAQLGPGYSKRVLVVAPFQPRSLKRSGPSGSYRSGLAGRTWRVKCGSIHLLEDVRRSVEAQG
ncbi:unnamed protein product [Lampetra planeri]